MLTSEPRRIVLARPGPGRQTLVLLWWPRPAPGRPPGDSVAVSLPPNAPARREERGNQAGHVGKGHPGHRRGTARGNVTVASSFRGEGRESNPACSEPLNLCVAAVV